MAAFPRSSSFPIIAQPVVRTHAILERRNSMAAAANISDIQRAQMMSLKQTLGDAKMRRLLALLLLPQACAPIEQRVSTITNITVQQVWALHSLAGKRAPGRIGSVATLRFVPGETVSGTIMCNSITSTKLRWTQDGGSTRGGFDQLANDAGIVTTAGCPRRPGSAMADRFWKNLETARAWSMTGTLLVIEFGDGSEARLVALERSR